MRLLLAICLVMAGGVWFATGGTRITSKDFAPIVGDAAAGERIFWASGCASCHAAPGSEGDGNLILAGGQRFKSPFGTFVAPNISPDPAAGIGSWTPADFTTALRHGVSPTGQHYYPAFPYTSYTRMTERDVADLWAFLQGLPGDATPNIEHELSFPFSIRRSVAFWKWINLSDAWVMQAPATEQIEQGRYLVEALGHCAECHTSRNAFGGLQTDRWMAGAPNPSGKGTIPDITPGALDWSADDIAYYLSSGFTPSYDSAGGHMAAVVSNFSKLSDQDRLAVAVYLKALQPSAR